MTAIPFSCQCGQVAGMLDVPSSAAGNHIICHCPDCRASAIHLGRPDPGAKQGTELWHTTPDRVTLTQGTERLEIQQLSPKGPYRWYANCCNTPLFDTLRGPRLAFVGLSVACLSDSAALGPLIGQAFMKGPDRKYHHEGFNRIGLRIAKMMLSANLSGAWRKTPFFDADGTPIAPVHVLTKDERAAATPKS